MFRFGTKSMMIGFALMALWLSTFSGFAAAADVRRSMLLLILVASAFAAIYFQGKRRAFWAGFAIIMLMCGGLDIQRPLNRYAPDFLWQGSMGLNIQAYSQPYSGGVYAQPYLPDPMPYDPSSPSPPQIVYPSPPVVYQPVFTGRSATWIAVGETLAAIWTFGLSALGGFIAAYIFAQSRRVANEPSTRAREIVDQELRAQSHGR